MGIFSKWAESLDYDYEILESCTRRKSPRSSCTSCIDVCDMNAVSILKGVPVIKNGKCIECGKCIAACPVQAVAGIFPKRMMVQHQLVVTEGESPAAKELLIYFKKGIKSLICEKESLNEDWEQAIHEANDVLQQLGESPLSIEYRGIDKTADTYTRRELFFSWKSETQSFMRQMVPAKWRFNQNDLELAKYYPSHQFSEISLDIDKCVLCKACLVLCNKKCLSITEESFSINAQNCSSCRLCQDICPEKAISVEEKVMAKTAISYRINKKVCSKCNKSFETLSESKEECVMCVKRKGFLSPQ